MKREKGEGKKRRKNNQHLIGKPNTELVPISKHVIQELWDIGGGGANGIAKPDLG